MAAFRADQILSDIVAVTEFAYIDQLINEYVATILANHTNHAFFYNYLFMNYRSYLNDIFMYSIRKYISDI
jgi:hypothetical protein